MSVSADDISNVKVFDILNRYEDDIVESFHKYNAVGVIAPSATGKSLLIPLYLAKTGTRVLVASINRNAAKSLASFFSTLVPSMLCSYLDERGELRYGPKDQTRNESRIVYTSVSYLRKLLQSQFVDGNPQNYSDYSVIMIDEIHTGTVDQTICLGLWRSASSIVLFPRLLMTTATPVDYMNKVSSSYKEFDLRVDTSTPYPIERKWIPVEISGLDIYSKRKSVYQNIVQQVVIAHRDSPVESGHMIIFLDTKDAVANVGNMIVSSIAAMNLQDRGVVVLKVHGRMDPETAKSLYSNTWTVDENGNVKTDNIRKIIVSTNVLESSVTIPYVGHVFDSMLRMRSLESSTGRMVPTLVYASRNSSIQAAGRTGRTNPGINYIFLSEQEFYKLPEQDPPELSVSPISRHIIELLQLRLNPSDIIFDIPHERISTATNELESLGLIQSGSRVIYQSGIFCSQFDSLTIRNSLVFFNFMIATQNRNTLYYELVLSCILDLDVTRLFRFPKRTNKDYKIELQKHTERFWKNIIGLNQVETILNVWRKIGDMSKGEALIPKNIQMRKKICKKIAVRAEVLDQLVKMVESSIQLFSKLFPGVYISHRDGHYDGNTMSNFIKIVSKIYSDSILNTHFLHYSDRTPIPNTYFKFGPKGQKGISYVVLNNVIPGPLQDYNEIVVLSKVPYQNRYKVGIRYNFGVLLHLPTSSSVLLKDQEILSKLQSARDEEHKIESVSFHFEGLLPDMEAEVTYDGKELPDVLCVSKGKEKEQYEDVPPNILVPRRSKVELQQLGQKILENSVIKVLQLPKDLIIVPRGALVGKIMFKV